MDENEFTSFSLSWNADVLKVERWDDSAGWVEIMLISDRQSDGYNYDINHLIVGWGEEEAVWSIDEPIAIYNEDDPEGEFIYDLKVRKGVTTALRFKSCKWLSKKDTTTIVEICDGGIEYPGNDTAADVCPITCSID